MTLRRPDPSGARALVVHVITLLEWGGAQENTLYTAGHLDPARFEGVLVAGPGGRLDGEARSLAGLRFRTVASLAREVRPVRDLRAFFALRSIFQEEKRRAGGRPLIVHTHSSKAGILGRAAAKAEGADLVLHTIHGYGFNDTQPAAVKGLYKLLERRAAGWSDALIAVSAENARLGVRQRIFPAEKCRVIRSGFDTARFLGGAGAAGRKLIGVEEGVPLVGTIAAFKPQKAPGDFVEVARLVSSKVPDARFVMVGDGEMRPEVERKISSAGLSGRFHLTGWRPEIPDLLAAFDVFLLTSRWEGLPKVVPQALISGVPVVATRVDGTGEAVDDGLDGFLAMPGDVETMSEKVVGLLSGGRLAGVPGKRDRLLREFDQDAMVREQERLYGELLARKGFPGWAF